MKAYKLYPYLTNQWIFSSALFLLLFIITMNHPMFFDEGLWHYIGKIWSVDGLPAYKFSVENKVPGIYYLYMLSNALFGVTPMFVRILGMLAIVANALLIKRILSIVHTELSGILGMYIYGLSNSWFVVSGMNPAVTDGFMAFFMVLSILFLLRFEKPQVKFLNLFFSGFFMGCAVSFKQTAVLAFIAMLVMYLILFSEKYNGKQHVINLVFLILSGVFAHFLFVLPLLLSGVSFMEYFEGAWLILLNSGTHESSIQWLYDFLNYWFNTKIAIFLIIIPLSFYFKTLFKNPFFKTVLILLVFCFIGVSLPGTYNEQQFKLVLVPFALLLGPLVMLALTTKVLDQNNKGRFVALLIGIVLIALPYRCLIINGYFSGFPNPEAQVGKWIKQHSQDSETLFTFTNAASGPIMAYSDCLSPVKNFNLIFVNTEREKAQLNAELMSNPPNVLVLERKRDMSWGKLNNEFLNQYEWQHRIDCFDIYFLK